MDHEPILTGVTQEAGAGGGVISCCKTAYQLQNETFSPFITLYLIALWPLWPLWLGPLSHTPRHKHMIVYKSLEIYGVILPACTFQWTLACETLSSVIYHSSYHQGSHPHYCLESILYTTVSVVSVVINKQLNVSKKTFDCVLCQWQSPMIKYSRDTLSDRIFVKLHLHSLNS